MERAVLILPSGINISDVRFANKTFVICKCGKSWPEGDMLERLPGKLGMKGGRACRECLGGGIKMEAEEAKIIKSLKEKIAELEATIKSNEQVIGDLNKLVFNSVPRQVIEDIKAQLAASNAREIGYRAAIQKFLDSYGKAKDCEELYQALPQPEPPKG
jgi:uncharacterized coiled-coil protein SlyX